MKISFVIPTLNEEEGIAVAIKDINAQKYRDARHDVEILVVDGASTDDTKKVAEANGATVITEPRKGYGRAYKTGFAAATGDVIITGDADGTYPFDLADQYLEKLQTENLDFITCNRYAQLEKGAMSALHRLGNWTLSTTARLLFRVKLRDSQSGMWIFRRNVLPILLVDDFSDGMPFSQEIKLVALKRLGAKAIEIPSLLRPRVGEAVIASWSDGFGNLGALFKRRRQWKL